MYLSFCVLNHISLCISQALSRTISAACIEWPRHLISDLFVCCSHAECRQSPHQQCIAIRSSKPVRRRTPSGEWKDNSPRACWNNRFPRTDTEQHELEHARQVPRDQHQRECLCLASTWEIATQALAPPQHALPA